MGSTMNTTPVSDIGFIEAAARREVESEGACRLAAPETPASSGIRPQRSDDAYSFLVRTRERDSQRTIERAIATRPRRVPSVWDVVDFHEAEDVDD